MDTATLKDKIWDDVLDLVTDPVNGVPLNLESSDHSYGCLAGVNEVQLRERVVWSMHRHYGADPQAAETMLRYFFGEESC